MTIGGPWRDRLRITPLSTVNNNGIILRYIRRASSLEIGQNYSETVVLTLNPIIVGTMYLRLHIDQRLQVVELNEMNNIVVSPAVIISPLYPDLAVVNFSIVDGNSIQGGENIEVEWVGINVGEVVLERLTWLDSIYLNSSQTLDRLDFVRISREEMLHPEMTYHERFALSLPLTLDYSQQYSLLLELNSGRDFNEYHRLSNNVRRLPVTLSPPPTPDLEVKEISFMYFPLSRVLTVQWTVQNIGNSMRSVMSWRDQVLLSPPGTVFNIAGGIILGSVDQSLRMVADQVYTLRDSTVVPTTVEGDFYVYIATDIANRLMEVDGEDNNFLRSNSTASIVPVSTAVLNISINTATLPSSFFTGDSFVLEYSVRNGPNTALRATSWVDGVYLSSVAAPSREYLLSDAFLLTQTLNNMQLEQNGTYTVSLNIILPQQLTGQFLMTVLLDVNDVLDITTTGRRGVLVNIAQSALPDLTVRVTTTDLNFTSGQPATISYKVSNEGLESAVGTWYEALILSHDGEIDPFDIRLITVRNLGMLGQNESYMQTVEVFVPFDLPTSSFYMFILVDTRDDIFESQVNNNRDTFVVNIMETISTDVSVFDVRVTPSSVNYTEPISFRWKLRNNGALQATGYKCDSVYLSADDSWDLADFEIGVPDCGPVTLNGINTTQGNQRSYSRSAMAPFIAQSQYYGIMRTRTNIHDPNLDNNIGYTASRIEVNAPHIALGVETTINIDPSDIKVFRIVGVPEEETLVATLTTEQENVYHDLYLRNRQTPTGSEHDAFSQFAMSANQRAVIRRTRSGDYYIRIESFTNHMITARYDVNILVKIARFEVLRVNPTKAAPLANATIKITGTVISYFCSAALISTNSDIEYHATKVYWFSSESLYATFDLAGAQVGNYTIRLLDENTGRTAQLNNTFVITGGVFGRLSLDVVPPGRLRPGETGDIVLRLQNIGNTDLLTPHMVISSDGVAVFRILDDFAPEEFRQQIDFLALPLEGPGGILPPGMSTELTFRVAHRDNGGGRARFSISMQNNGSAPHPFVNKKAVLRPQFIASLEIWDTVWENFLRSVGTVYQTFQERMSEVASEFSLVGKRIYSVEELVKYQIQIAYGVLSGKLHRITSRKNCRWGGGGGGGQLCCCIYIYVIF